MNLRSRQQRHKLLTEAAAVLPQAPDTARAKLEQFQGRTAVERDVFLAGKVAGILALVGRAKTVERRTALALLAQHQILTHLDIRARPTLLVPSKRTTKPRWSAPGPATTKKKPSTKRRGGKRRAK